MSKPLPTAFICQPCFKRLFRTTSRRSNSASALPPPPPTSGRAKLTLSRRLIAIHGVDAPKYLNGAITARIPEASYKEGFYSAFLNAQGRVLYDVFIYPINHSSIFLNSASLSEKSDKADPGYIIECDATSTKSVLSHIKKYKLRSKFTYRLLDEGEWDVWSAWGKDAPETIDLGCRDNRAPGMGMRLLLPDNNAPSRGDTGDLAERLAQYTLRRYLHGVPEGQLEMPEAASLPQESNIDYMGGIDYRKGCYVGQELTIRTHHTGVVRKRILPVQLYPFDSTIPSGLAYVQSLDVAPPPTQSNIDLVGKKTRSVGKYLAGIGNLGLALCRLEMMTDIVLTDGNRRKQAGDEFSVDLGAGDVSTEQIKIAAFVPEWHRAGETSNKAL